QVFRVWADGMLEEYVRTNPTPVRLAQAKVLLIDRFFEWRASVPKIQNLLAQARGKGVQVIHSLASGTNVSDILKEVTPVEGEPAVSSGPDKFLGTDLEKILKERAIQTVIVVGTEKEAMGILTIRDIPRPEAKETIAQLKSLGIKKVVMLTGDDDQVAESVAKELGIDEYKARLLPEEKVRAVEEYQQKYGPIIMVGDGVNDAPALARAEVGVAMGGAGTDIALEAADVALMGDDLRTLVYGIRLSRKAAGVIKQNVSVSLFVKILFFALVFPGLITLWLAILIGDLGTSFGVITNALRLARY
ncbi:MAG: HAD-IC family P-type ATPase, partial [Methanomassiliicoccales archaeon]|nr:HAD-IC family P-type ATPase [Methanomassiliicoccales archaeon]